jgi:hypothetical protein
MSPLLDAVLDSFDRLEYEQVGLRSQSGHGIEQHADFHASLLCERNSDATYKKRTIKRSNGFS